MNENGDISLCFLPLLGERGDLSRSVVLLDDQATSPSVAVVEEGPQRSPYLSLSSPRRNSSGESLRALSQANRRWNDQEPNDSSFKRQKIKGYMLKSSITGVASGTRTGESGEWRGRQDHTRVEHCITGLALASPMEVLPIGGGLIDLKYPVNDID
ncbi:hypothetical protein HID58_072807 [Brassica napus]|uniref:Uncharacterized protein n=1 Tax=Brassica napus TaxID=3708 RepID=A0ABQ7Z5H1_BRANA|nr:hypothetical protein HID58_072807 [Brassica napus]